MSPPIPAPDDHSGLREALQRAAARIKESPFDAALHHATIRRIHVLADRGASVRVPWLKAGFATVAALLAIGVSFTRRGPSRVQPDAAAIASSRNAIANFSVKPASSLPAWASPTAPLLDHPRILE